MFRRSYGLVFLFKNYLSALDHDLMAKIWEKAISILAGNLNSGLSYLITAVLTSCLSGSAVVLTSYSPSLTLRIVFTVLTNGRLKNKYNCIQRNITKQIHATFPTSGPEFLYLHTDRISSLFSSKDAVHSYNFLSVLQN